MNLEQLPIMNIKAAEHMDIQVADLVHVGELHKYQKILLSYNYGGKANSVHLQEMIKLLNGIHNSGEKGFVGADYTVADLVSGKELAGWGTYTTPIGKMVLSSSNGEGSQIPASHVDRLGESAIDPAMYAGPNGMKPLYKGV